MMNTQLFHNMAKVLNVLTVEKNYSKINISNNVENYLGFEAETSNFEICVDEKSTYVRESTGNPRKIIFTGTLDESLDFIRKTF